MLEAQLVYRPVGGVGAVPIGTSVDERVLGLLRDRILEDAWVEACRWEGVDTGVYAIKLAEVERLGRALAVLVPRRSPRPHSVHSKNEGRA